MFAEIDLRTSAYLEWRVVMHDYRVGAVAFAL